MNPPPPIAVRIVSATKASFVFPHAETRRGSSRPWPTRMAKSVVLLAAAYVESHTDAAEGWVISVDGMNEAGKGTLAATLSIELVGHDEVSFRPVESERAELLLRQMAAVFDGATYDHLRGVAKDANGNTL